MRLLFRCPASRSTVVQVLPIDLHGPHQQLDSLQPVLSGYESVKGKNKMKLTGIPEEFSHLFREPERELDFGKIAEATRAPLTSEGRAALTTSAPDFSDFRDYLHNQALGIPQSEDSPFTKLTKGAAASSTDIRLAKRFIEEHGCQSSEARHCLSLQGYYAKHGHEAGGLVGRLAGMVEKAMTILGPGDCELLEKAVKALDVYLIAFFLEKAFAGVNAVA
jgi:hypothetical protein